MHSFGGKDLISAWEIPCELLLLKLYEVFEIYRETIKCDGGNTRKNGAVLAVQAAGSLFGVKKGPQLIGVVVAQANPAHKHKDQVVLVFFSKLICWHCHSVLT